jgi:hypothetical protein
VEGGSECGGGDGRGKKGIKGPRLCGLLSWSNLTSYCYVAGGCLLSLILCSSGFHDLLRDRLSSLLM